MATIRYQAEEAVYGERQKNVIVPSDWWRSSKMWMFTQWTPLLRQEQSHSLRLTGWISFATRANGSLNSQVLVLHHRDLQRRSYVNVSRKWLCNGSPHARTDLPAFVLRRWKDGSRGFATKDERWLLQGSVTPEDALYDYSEAIRKPGRQTW